MTIGTSRHALYGGWIGDPVVDAALSAEADVTAILRFEAALAQAQAEHGLVPLPAAAAIARAAIAFAPDWGRLREDAARDGVAVPGLVAQLGAALGPEAAPHLHLGATSQDAIDTSLMLRLAALAPVFERRLEGLAARLDDLDARFGHRPLMAVTRGREARPIAVGDRLAAWRAPLIEQRARLGELRREAMAVQLGGPVGVLDLPRGTGTMVRAGLARKLALADPGGAWHTDRRRLLAIAAWLAATAASLGKIGADVALMAQDRIDAVALRGGRSSAMPHKVNPVDAELLVALARQAAALSGAMATAGLHETERSGAAWTLEWLALEPLVSGVGGATLAAERLLDAIERLGPED